MWVLTFDVENGRGGFDKISINTYTDDRDEAFEIAKAHGHAPERLLQWTWVEESELETP